MTRRQLRLQRIACRRILCAIAVTTGCAAWFCASGLATVITT